MWKGALLALFSYGLQAYARPTLARSTVHAARRGPTNAPARYARGESLAAYTFARLTTTCALEALVPEWTNFCRAAAPHNPFAHPLWMTTWARHFVTPNDLYVITMRGKAGELVAVAPFYRRHIAVGPSVIETRLHLLGAGQHTSLTELPQIVIQPGLERAVLRGLVGYLGAHAADWDWIELALTPEQGWLEPEWLPRNGAGQGSFGLHKATRPCVVLPLPCSLEALQGGLKRNVKESLRRGANSLTRAGYNWEVTTPETLTDLTRSLNTLVDLHRSRAAGGRGAPRRLRRAPRGSRFPARRRPPAVPGRGRTGSPAARRWDAYRWAPAPARPRRDVPLTLRLRPGVVDVQCCHHSHGGVSAPRRGARQHVGQPLVRS